MTPNDKAIKRARILAIILVALIAVVLGVIFISSGLKTRTDVGLLDFSVSEDGKELTLDIGVFGSIGYVRSIKPEKVNNALYCSFYSTFGLNCNIGAKQSFKVNLDESISQVYFDRGNGIGELVLKKDKGSGDWVAEGPNSK